MKDLQSIIFFAAFFSAQCSAHAAPLNKCVGGEPWYRGSTTSQDIRGQGEFFRRPDGSMYFIQGHNNQIKEVVDVACFDHLRNPPQVYNSNW